MCGIAGSYQIDPARPTTGERIHAALRCIAHRGPDDEGVYARGRAVLGHRRLSVIDTSPAGHQPFTLEGDRYTIVFNGEVFNFQALRAELEASGHRFRSRTDTEVVLRLFTVKGPAFLHDLNGFFALAIHDAATDTLFLARDRYGVKPLLWCEADGRFLFGSELRALTAMGAPRTVDNASVEQLFLHQFIPAPATIHTGIHKLLPGHALHVEATGVREERRYHLPDAIGQTPKGDAGQQLYALLDDAVRLRLVADVPVGTFLSGGVDSSIVTALAAKHHNALHTFSIGYAEDRYYDESAYAEEVAAHLGTTHHSFRLTHDELAEAYPRLLAAIDEPFTDSSALPSFVLCERTRKHVTVALSGDGADEVFGGYRKHQAELRWSDPGPTERAVVALAPLWRVLPRSRKHAWQDKVRQFDRFARFARLDPITRSLMLTTFTDASMARQLVGTPAPAAEVAARETMLMAGARDLPGMNGVLLSDVLNTLPNNMLHKVDLTSMAHALEVRTPFLDKRVVELAFALAPERKLHKGSGKHLLRTTFGHLLPATVMSRSKKGFEVPLLALFNGPLRSFLDRTLTPVRISAAGLSVPAVEQVVRQLRSVDPGTAEATLHAIIVYIMWWERTFAGPSDRTPAL